MAALWNMLREEVLGTVDDFRQKGAIGALRDAALDTKDMALDAGGWLVDGVKGIVANDDEESEMAYVVGPDVPKRGSTCTLHLPDGKLVEATAIDVDGVSDPPRARVTAPELEEPLLVPVLDPAAVEQMKEAASNAAGGNALADTGRAVFQGVKEEFNNTVQEFREKGAIGAVKDAALDAADLVGNTAKTAVSGARSLAEPVAQDFREKGAVGAVKDAALDAVDIIGSTAKTAVNGAQTLATPLIDLLSDDTTPATKPDGEGAPAAQDKSAAAAASGDAAEGAVEDTSLLGELRQEWRNTVQDFREKGAVSVVKDAALDAVDLVGNTATTALGAATTATNSAVGVASTAIKGARARAAPLIEQVSSNLPDLWTDTADAGASASSATPAASQGDAPPSTGAAASSAAPAEAAAQAEPKPKAEKPRSFVPPARVAEDSSGAEGSSSGPAEVSMATPRVGSSSPGPKAVPESSMPASSNAAGRKSLVSMRRGMFEKPKPTEETKNEAEELID